MEKIKIITDSTADLPKSIIEKYDIEVLPLIVNFGDEAYLDGVDINSKEFFKKMKESDIFPTTSQINPQRFYQSFKKYLDEGYKVIYIGLSSKMSGTFQSACIGRDMLDSENIVVIDSQNVTAGLGVLVIKAAKLKEKGLTLKEIEKEIIDTLPHVKSALAFGSLDNLVKGGRLSKTAGAIGNLLNIKLILCVKDGEMAVREKVRGNKKAIKNILDYLETETIDKKETAILLNAEGDDMLESLRIALEEGKCDFIESEVGCVVGTHSGTGACGIFFIEKY